MTSRSATSRCRRTALRSGSRRRRTGATICSLFPLPGARRSASCRAESIAGVNPGAGFVVFSKSSLTAPAGDLPRVRRRHGVKPLTRENDVMAERRGVLRAREPHGPRQQAARSRYWLIKPPNFDATKKVSGRLSDPRRAAGRVGGRVVDALEPVALGGAGLGRLPRRIRAGQPASVRSSSIEITRRLGRARHDGNRRGRRGGLENAVRRRAPASALRVRATAATR